MKSRILLYIVGGVLLLVSGCNPQAESSKLPTVTHQAASQPSSRGSDSAIALRQPDSVLYFLNGRDGWVLLGGTLYTTTDGGKSWTKINQHDLSDCRSVIFAARQNGWAVCDQWATEKRSNSVLHTQNGGRSWREVLKLPTPIYAINFLNEKVGYVSGRWYPIQRTADGGETWRELDGTEGLNYLYFLDEKQGWGYGGAIWHTADGGGTWKQVVKYENAGDLWSADFVDASTGWIIGAEHQVWRTTDGRTWQQVTNLPDVAEEFHSVDFINRDEGWITSKDGHVLHTVNGGVSWQSIALLPQGAGSIKFLTNKEGWMVNSKGDLLYTVDGGRSWNAQPLS